MSPAIAERPALRIVLGRDPPVAFDPGVPVLAGDTSEELFADAQPAGEFGAFRLFTAAGWLLGAATVEPGSTLDPAAHRLYLDLLQATRGRHLARIWNYVPAINETGPAGLENYRAFCQGRSLAFEETLGADFKFLVPSASAVGSRAGSLTVVFAASEARPRHVENSRQVPAYDYPRQYGPRAPSFARATIVPGKTAATVFISGTAAIRGHATVAPESTTAQLDCTLENLREISAACGLGPDLAAGRASSRHFKVYVRHATDQPLVTALLAEKLFRPGDRVSCLHADICRHPLLVEIEATLFGVSHVPRAANP